MSFVIPLRVWLFASAFEQNSSSGRGDKQQQQQKNEWFAIRVRLSTTA